jgi:hypothetical protein
MEASVLARVVEKGGEMQTASLGDKIRLPAGNMY